MLSKKLEKAINDQIAFEFYSSYTYLAIAAYLETLDFGGIASFFAKQAEEEIGHGMKFYNYVNEKGGIVRLDAIDKPKETYKDLVEIFETALAHEELVTKKINNIMDIAIEEKDYATRYFLDWFVEEQVEEEDTMRNLLTRVKRCKNDPSDAYILDKQLGERE